MTEELTFFLKTPTPTDFTMDFNYKTYSLEKLEEWICDVIDSDEVTPQEIADVIYISITNSIVYHEKCLNRSKKILEALGGNVDFKVKPKSINYDDVVKFENEQSSWTVPVDDDGVVTFPDSLIKKTGWKEGDTLDWIDQKDGTFLLKKSKREDYDSMISNGYEMTGDGFWIKGE